MQLCSRTKSWLVQLICLAVWFFCFLLSIPDWMYLKVPSDPEKEGDLKCVHEYPSKESRLGSRLSYHLLGFFLFVMVLLYCSALALMQRRSDQRVQKQRAMRVILALVLAFFISWTPYNIALLVDTISSSPDKVTESCEAHRWTAVKSTAVLGFLHSCLNPLIYFGFSEKFRHWVLAILKCVSCAVGNGDFFPWDSQEVDKATPVSQEEKGSLHPMSDIKLTITQQQDDKII